MKQFFTALSLLLLLCAGLRAQSVAGPHIGAAGSLPTWGQATSSPDEAQPAAKPLGEKLKLSYYDPSLPIRVWPAPADFGGLVSILYGQRFTLPSDGGFVDSIRLNFAAIAGAEVGIALVPDTLFETSPGTFYHLIDIFSERDAYAEAVIGPTSLPADGWVTVSFDHVAVPKQFFVVAMPNFQAGGTFELRGDAKPTRVRTTDDSRSAMVAVITSQNLTMSMILDSFIIFTGEEEPAFTDFYIEAYVETGAASVAQQRNADVAVYPNPVAGTRSIRIASASGVRSVQLLNALGANVGSWTLAGSEVHLPLGDIPAGMYLLRITGNDGIRTERLIVQ